MTENKSEASSKSKHTVGPFAEKTFENFLTCEKKFVFWGLSTSSIVGDLITLCHHDIY